MTREEAKELLPIIKALAEGKMIQDKIEGLTDWCDTDEINLEYNRKKIKHRIKPEPFYRPFYSQEECVKEMMNHTPFGIITDGISILKAAIYPNGIHVVCLSVPFHIMPFSKALESIMFSDGKEFGIKVQP